MKVEYLDDLGERVAQRVVHPSRQYQGAVAQRRAGQCIAYLRFDFLLASLAPVAVDRVFCDFRMHVRDIFDVACTGLFAATQRTTAIGTFVRSMLGFPIDLFGNSTPRSRMPPLAAWLLLATSRRRRLGIGWFHARRRGGRLMRSSRLCRLLLGQSLGQFQQCEDNRLFAPRIDLAGLFFRQARAQRYVQCRNSHGVRALPRTPMSYDISSLVQIPTSLG